MVHVLSEMDQPITVPDWVLDLDSFSRWIDSEDVSEKASIWYLAGKVWVDVSREQVFTHGLVKTKYAARLTDAAETEKSGMYFCNGVRLTNQEVGFSVKPDGIFVSNITLKRGRVRLVEGMEEGFVELGGTPDMTLEVVSASSVEKDTVLLLEAYAAAGIREYWLVDARRDPLSFEILRLTSRGYVASRKQRGWIKSAVFGKEFRLVRRTRPLGHPDFSVEMR